MKTWPSLSLPPKPDNLELRPLSLFDTASQKIQALPIKNQYRMYVCGITPYDATHLGHAATYLAFDLIHRYLRATGANVLFTENTTDIDDPLLERAIRDKISWQELAKDQIELYFSDMVALHILPPQNYIGVVESVDFIADAAKEIEARGYAYRLNGDLYCDIEKDLHFGERSHLHRDELRKLFAERGGDPDRPGKRSPFDPLLWKAKREGEPSWESSVGEGRPGWHIECQAIALKFLGGKDGGAFIDIQGGGSDLIFPHHEMSASQTFLQTGREFSELYVHAGMIGLDGEKMSKSRGNLVFVSKLIEGGVDPMAIRLALLSQHYQSDRMWSNSLLAKAEEFLQRLRDVLSRESCAPTQEVLSEIAEHLSNNLDTVQAILALEKWEEKSRKGISGGNAGELSRGIDLFLGLAL